MLHIKDIEAFARINEALARNTMPPRAPDPDGHAATGATVHGAHAASLAFARLAAGMTAQHPAWPRPAGDSAVATAADPAMADAEPESMATDTIGDVGQVSGIGYDFDLVPHRPATLGGFLTRLLLGRRRI